MAVARHLSGHVGVASHLSGQALKAGLRLSHADGQQTWTATGHLIQLIVPTLSRRRAYRGEPLGIGCITNVVSLTNIMGFYNYSV